MITKYKSTCIKPLSVSARFSTYVRKASQDNFKAGFTLIELSIVLVIIGLVTGGILLGRDLIGSAQLQSIITDKNKYITATNTFKLKYDELPGDMTKAVAYWGAAGPQASSSDNYTYSCHFANVNYVKGSTGTCNGNGDGHIDAEVSITNFYQTLNDNAPEEPILFWQHLDNARMIPGSYYPFYGPGTLYGADPNHSTSRVVVGINIPMSKANSNAGYMVYYMCINDGTFFSPGICGHYMFYGAQALTGNENFMDFPLYPTLTPAEAQSIDAKIDDGRPATGQVTALPTNFVAGNFAFTPNCTTATYNNPSIAQYNMSNTAPQCSLIFYLGF